MKNLIPILRADRLREMNEYDSRGYHFRAEKKAYNYVRNISVSDKKICNDSETKRCYKFEVRTNQEEPKFFITVISEEEINEYCIYLKIIEIYHLLISASKSIGISKINDILQSDRSRKWHILYTGLDFELNLFSADIPDGKLIIPSSNIEITYENLFILLALIQDKSNYYWSISTENNHQYADGIIRLITCLLNTKGNATLEERGWKYNNTSNIYELTGADNSFKYHLTHNELINIMEVRNPSNFVNDEGV